MYADSHYYHGTDIQSICDLLKVYNQGVLMA